MRGTSMATITASPLAEPQQIQGNILRPFAGRRQAFLFLSFRSERAGARTWLGALAGRVAGTEDVGAARHGTHLERAASLLNVGLTATGLVLLHPEAAGDLVAYDAFWRGPLGTRLDDAGRLTTAAALLGDVGRSDPTTWVVGGPGGPPVDALLTVAAEDDQTFTEAVAHEERAAAAAGLEVLRVERGEVLRHGNRRIEHFGFTDGISQPGNRGFREAGRVRPGSPVIAAGEFVLGCPGERRPQAWTPRPRPAAWLCGGSFQVFRRLRQDVAGWWERMGELAGADSTPEEAAARALGRRLDGTPLAPGARPDEQNDFSYRDDASGAHTPLHAHIRKMNPREDDVFRDRGHKMLRRGIPFGPRFDRDHPDDAERGMLFNAYVAGIEDQFEYVQRRWANDPGFPTSATAKFGRGPGGDRLDGLDPVLGPDAETARATLPEDVVRRIPPTGFGGFVTTTGAVYAFAPSRPALERLAGDAPLH